MQEKNKISLTAAILINVNIIIGAGIFLNVKPLTQIAGSLGFFGYIFGSIILFPFVYSLAKLAQLHPVSGGLYVYSKEHLNPFVGFLSGWSYFIGKTISAAFLSYSFATFFQNRILFLQQFHSLLLTSIVIFSLISLNIIGVHIGGKIQLLFITIKMIPVLFVLIFGLTIFQPQVFDLSATFKSTTFSGIPIALYALMGFEITCSISHLIKNASQNAFRAMLGSFIIVVIIHILFQTILFGALSTSLLSYPEPLAALAHTIFTKHLIIGRIISSLVFTSVIAGSFGILTSNCWNLHVLAKNNHLPFKNILTKKSATNVPSGSLILEGVIAVAMIAISKNQIALQSMSVFGVVLSFLLSAIAAFQASKNKYIKSLPIYIPTLSIACCCYILFLCFQKISQSGISLPFIVMLLSGIIITLIKQNKILSNF